MEKDKNIGTFNFQIYGDFATCEYISFAAFDSYIDFIFLLNAPIAMIFTFFGRNCMDLGEI
jgi:hypothetical protein